LRAVQARAGGLGAAALSPARGQHRRPGKAGSAVFLEQALRMLDKRYGPF